MLQFRQSERLILALIFLLLVLPVASSFYKYYFTKNYDYLIEAPCDPETEICFTRDCSNPDDCPPNGLTEYKQFFVKAADFTKCNDNSCAEECLSKQIQCQPIGCGESADDVCTQPKT